MDGADIAVIGSSLTAAMAAHSINALVGVVRQLSAIQTDAGEEAMEDAAKQAARAMEAMEAMLATNGGPDAPVESLLDVANAGGRQAMHSSC